MNSNLNIARLPLEDLPQIMRFGAKYLRNKANIRVGSIISYFTKQMFIQCFNKVKDPFDEKTLTLNEKLNFKIEKIPGTLIRDVRPRFGHIDLGLKADSTGISLGYLDGFVQLPSEYYKPGEEGEKVVIPVIKFDFIGRISAEFFPKKEVAIRSIRSIFFECLRRGAVISLITLDGWQSSDTMQIFKEEGIHSDRLSIDNTAQAVVFDSHSGEWKRTPTKNPAAAMDCLWLTAKEKRLELSFNEQLLKEAVEQEKDERTGKVIKIPGGTDDVIQSVAGTVFNITENLNVAAVSITKEIDWRNFAAYTEEAIFQERMNENPVDQLSGKERGFEDKKKGSFYDKVFEDPDEYFGDDIWGSFH